MIGIPRELRDFAILLNPTNLKTFNKIELLGLARGMLTTKATKIPTITQTLLNSGLEDSHLHRGVFALRVYFYQLLSDNVISLDLRKSRFSYSQGWHFEGKHLGFRFDNSLREALVDMYKCYYLDEIEQFEPLLEKMQLIHPSWPQSARIELQTLFLNHFRPEDKTQQFFRLSNLIHSFSNIFAFINRQGGKVPSEFSLLGIYLTSLYLTLNELKEPIDVEEAFKIALKSRESELA